MNEYTEQQPKQRVIKFRCWDSKENKMCGGYAITDSFFNHKGNRELILMQFTGLLDKNKVEIYEGNLLRIKFKTQYYALEAIYEVIHRGFTTELVMRKLITPSEVFSDIRLEAGKDFEWYAGQRLEITCRNANGRESSSDIEVIGNIYEHKHLLS